MLHNQEGKKSADTLRSLSSNPRLLQIYTPVYAVEEDDL